MIPQIYSMEQMEQRRTDTREGTRDQKRTTGRPVMRGGKGGEEGWSRRKRASVLTSRRSEGWRRGRETACSAVTGTWRSGLSRCLAIMLLLIARNETHTHTHTHSLL